MTSSYSEKPAPLASGTPEHVDKLRVVLNICRRMSAITDLASLQALITREAKELLQADRVSVFLFDRDNCELWSAISEEGKIMRFDARPGIAGAVAMTGKAINTANAYEHPLFYKEVDPENRLSHPHPAGGAALQSRRRRHPSVSAKRPTKSAACLPTPTREILTTLAAQLADVIENSPIASELKTHKQEPRRLPRPPNSSAAFATQKIVGMSHRIESIIRLIDQIRPSSVDVLIQGESGTGKELIAKALHFDGPRAKYPFIALNCAALPDNLVETELFGIEKGVATGVDRRIGKFEAAHGGTLFLDEIGDLSLSAQAKILRVVQERVHR